MHLRLISLFSLFSFLVLSLSASSVNSQYAAIQEAKDSLRRALEKSRLREYTPWKNLGVNGNSAQDHFYSHKIIFEPRGRYIFFKFHKHLYI